MFIPVSSVEAKSSTSILMIGNSNTYCYENNTIKHLKELTSKSGKKMTLSYVARGGARLSSYQNLSRGNGKLLKKKLDQRKWDVVVLQEETSAAVSGGSRFIDTVKTLTKHIRKNNQDARIILNCTWARETKHHTSDQEKMDSNFKKAAGLTGSEVIYTGSTFDKYYSAGGKLDMIKPNVSRNHATNAGYYLNACGLYTKIFNSSPENASYYGGINKKEAKKIIDLIITKTAVIKKIHRRL